jgi:uncharacterized protein with PQ loop repeat
MNCIGWVLYGILRQDYFIFFSNIFGLILGLFYCLTSITALSASNGKEQHDIFLKNLLEMMILGSVAIWAMVGLVVGVILPAELIENGIFVVGIMGCCCGLAYYGSFLSTMSQVIKTKDSSSLYLPTLLANLSNASLWVIYGMAVQDPVIWSPNFLGATLTIFQIATYFFYYAPRKRSQTLDGMTYTHPEQAVVEDDSALMLQNIPRSDEAVAQTTVVVKAGEEISNPLRGSAIELQDQSASPV